MFTEVYFLAFLCANTLDATVALVHHDHCPLILTSYIENGEEEKGKEFSEVDQSLFAGVNSHAGYFTVDKIREWNLFFWYFPAQGVDLETTPLIIWLQGGPGISCFFGLSEEIGPIRIVDDKVEKMPITWGSSYSLLFIDNPVGTGFSFTEGEKYATNEDEVGSCLLNFIQQFFQVFPELRKAPLFLAGESYAGKFISVFGHYIHNNKNDSMPINLKGVAIDDGWIDPPTLMHNSELGLQLGLLDPEQAKIVHKMEEDARQFWKEGNFEAYSYTAQKAFSQFRKYAPVSMYNYLNERRYDKDVIGVGSFNSFFNKTNVQSALHAKKMEYKSRSETVHSHFMDDKYKTVKPWLEELVEHYGVMCYNGQLDIIVAYALSVNTYRSLKWSGAQAYLDALRIPLYDEEDSTAVNSFVKASGNFMDVMVRGAGHFVTADKPRAAKQIIDMFINKFK